MASPELTLEDLDRLDFIEYENNLSEMPFEELRRTQKRAYLRFHLRPRILYYFLKNLNGFEKIAHVLHHSYHDAIKK